MNYPQIETERLVMRGIIPEDRPLIIQYMKDKSIHAHTIGLPYPYGDRDFDRWYNNLDERWLDGNYIALGIEFRGILCGVIAMILNKQHGRTELNYWVASDFRNNGIATEAIKGCVRYAFDELKMHKVFAIVLAGNSSSYCACRRAGLCPDGMMIDHYLKNGIYRSAWILSIVAEN